MTFEKALKIEKKRKPAVDHCTERTDAYLFRSSTDDWAMDGEGPIAVMKDSGKVYDLDLYWAISRTSKEIRSFDLLYSR